MQRIFRKKLLVVFFISLTQVVMAENNFEKKLSKADSLFDIGKYTESYDYYSELWETGKYSPQMLLRMSYIKEALGDYTNALFFLKNYYELSLDRKALVKMEELSEEYQLQGYAYSDLSFFETLVRKNKWVLATIAGVIAALFGFLAFTRKRKQEPHLNYLIGNVIASVIGLLFINVTALKSEAIVARNRVNLMDSPTAGGKVVQSVDKGHLLQVDDQTDIWIKSMWEGEVVYIRENNVKRL